MKDRIKTVVVEQSSEAAVSQLVVPSGTNGIQAGQPNKLLIWRQFQQCFGVAGEYIGTLLGHHSIRDAEDIDHPAAR